MWCAALDNGQYLAVNNGVRRSTTDSDALRSIDVPNLKTPIVPVAFWYKWRRRMALSRAGLPEARQPPADHRRLDGAAGFMIAPLAVDVAAGEWQLIRATVIFAKHFHQLFRRRFPIAIELCQPFFARCHLIVLHR